VSGHVVIDGRRLPVTGIRMASGKINVTCAVGGPVPAFEGVASVTVFGEDDRGLFQGQCLLSWPQANPQDMLTVQLWVGWDRCYGDAEEAVW
jgi:hypothetical protein